MKWRLLAAFSGLILVMLLAQDIPLVSYLRTIERDQLIAGLERDAFMLAGSSENLLSDEPDDGSAATLQTAIDAYAVAEGARVVVTDSDGLFVLGSDPTDTPGEDFSNRPEIADALSGSPTNGERSSKTAGENLVYVAVPVLSGSHIVGAVRITFPADVIDTRAFEKTKGFIAVGAISLLAAALAALFVASSITSPLRRLEATTEALAGGDLSHRADTDDGAPEIRALARSFNSMTEQLAELLERQRAFAGDASHQLRTPLTALRLQLERAADSVDTDPQAARERIEAASEETERLQRLVEGLLMLARSERLATASDDGTVTVDVTSLVRERAEMWQSLAEEKGVTIVADTDEGIHARAVPTALEQIVDNYVDNAIGAARSGDTITVIARRSADEVEVHVIDEGPGLSEEHLARVFDRFWRAPDAPHGGSGIGLAVVQQLARSSGGDARLVNRSDTNGIDASVTLRTAD
ncbi:MAG: ATP-binding protein [Ilumatobacteraceae bacterium]